MWIIKNEKYNNYFKKELFDNQYHFVIDKDKATRFHTKWEVNRILKKINNKNIVAVKE